MQAGAADVAAEGEAVAVQHPQDAHDADGAEAHHEHVEDALAAGHASVEEGEPGGHEQHQGRAGEDPRGGAGGSCGVDRLLDGRIDLWHASPQVGVVPHPASPGVSRRGPVLFPARSHSRRVVFPAGERRAGGHAPRHDAVARRDRRDPRGRLRRGVPGAGGERRRRARRGGVRRRAAHPGRDRARRDRARRRLRDGRVGRRARPPGPRRCVGVDSDPSMLEVARGHAGPRWLDARPRRARAARPLRPGRGRRQRRGVPRPGHRAARGRPARRAPAPRAGCWSAAGAPTGSRWRRTTRGCGWPGWSRSCGTGRGTASRTSRAASGASRWTGCRAEPAGARARPRRRAARRRTPRARTAPGRPGPRRGR